MTAEERLKKWGIPEYVKEFTFEAICSTVRTILRTQAEHLVGFVVLDMCSSKLGATKVVSVGPGLTIPSLEASLSVKLDMELASTQKFPTWYLSVGTTEAERIKTCRDMLQAMMQAYIGSAVCMLGGTTVPFWTSKIIDYGWEDCLLEVKRAFPDVYAAVQPVLELMAEKP